jgi:hypothetical protein
MMKRRIFTAVLVLVICTFAFAACKKDETPTGNQGGIATTAPAATPTPAPTTAPTTAPTAAPTQAPVVASAAGYYKMVSMTESGETFTAEDFESAGLGGSTFLIFNADGTGTFVLFYDAAEIVWNETEQFISRPGYEDEVGNDFTLEDGKLTLFFAEDTFLEFMLSDEEPPDLDALGSMLGDDYTEVESEPEITPIVPVYLTFTDYGLNYDEEDPRVIQPMSDVRLDSITLLHFHDHFRDFIENPNSMTYEEFAPWVGSEASSMSVFINATMNARTYHWITADNPNVNLGLEFRERNGEWLFHMWHGTNLRRAAEALQAERDANDND